MIYMYFDIRFQMVVIFSIYLEQIWFLIYLFQRYKKGRNPLIPRGLRPFLRKLEIGLEPTTPSLRVKCSTELFQPVARQTNLDYYISFFYEFQLFFLKRLLF